MFPLLPEEGWLAQRAGIVRNFFPSFSQGGVAHSAGVVTSRVGPVRVWCRKRSSGGYPVCCGHSTHEYPQQTTRRATTAAPVPAPAHPDPSLEPWKPSTLKVDRSTVDLFHNSWSGYRAQYYRGVRIGERANDYALKKLTPRIKELLAGHEERTCPGWWVGREIIARPGGESVDTPRAMAPLC